MAGLVPAIHAVVARADAGRLGLHHDQQAHGILYTGVTSDIGRRANEHHEGLVKGFTKRYGLKHGVLRYRHGGDPAQVRHEALAARLEGPTDRELQPGLAGLV